MKTKDGQGSEIADEGDYYVQDVRGLVGNCASWWRANGQGYCCDLREAGVYKGTDVRSMRDTDVPWPVWYIQSLIVHHVRGDAQALNRKDQPVREARARRNR
jgi:hypothetical protein